MQSGEHYSQQDFSGPDFAHAALRDCDLQDCLFIGCSFRAADLTGAVFKGCQFNDSESQQPADFAQAQLREAVFERCNLTVVEFTRCSGYALSLQHCQMQGADLSKSDFRLPVGDSDLVSLNINHCNLSYANLANNYLVASHICDCRMLEVCLDYCDLSQATLMNNELHNVSATGLTLRGADLRGSSFNNIHPANIDLQDVRLYYSQLNYLSEALGLLVEADP